MSHIPFFKYKIKLFGKYLLYCITRNSFDDQINVHKIQGIDNYPLDFVNYQDILAIISPIPVDGIGSSILHFQSYEKALSSLQSNSFTRAVIPMRFGCIFHEISTIKEILEKNFQKYDKLLMDLDGCVEMGIRLFIKSEPNPNCNFQSSNYNSNFSGKDFINALKQRNSQQIPEEIQIIFKKTCEFFSDFYVKCELDCKDSAQYPSIYFLVKKNLVDRFRKRFLNFSKLERSRFFLNGPWPPYNFSSLGL